jgi:hypothetical protein
MRNVPFAFLNEETIDRINHAERAYVEKAQVDALANLAQTQMSMRGFMTQPVRPVAMFKKLVALLEKMMEMSGPNSIANLERALRAHGVAPRSEQD